MTLLCRPPLRLLHRLAASRPHAATVRSQVSVVNLLQHRLASKASNASPKSGLDQYPTSALEAARKLGMATRYSFVLGLCTHCSSVPTTSASIQCPRFRDCHNWHFQACRPVYPQHGLPCRWSQCLRRRIKSYLDGPYRYLILCFSVTILC
jgi:hypothetical protein